MELYRIGNFAKSLAGHDRGEIYVIVKEEGDYLYLSNGKNRMVENPKKKKKKHVQPIYAAVSSGYPELKNEEIKKAIRQIKQEG